MPTLNLSTKTTEQELVKAYLTANASDILADKINNGVEITKDGKQLVNRKDLDGFMKFACDEARKKAQNGVNAACVQDDIVYGWAVHYFEEDGIIGKLFNLDGSEYKPPAPKVEPKPVTKYTPPPAKPKEPTLFDLLEQAPKTPEPEELVEQESVQSDPVILGEKEPEDEPDIDEIADSLQAALDKKNGVGPEKKPEHPLYESYSRYALRYPDSVIIMRVGDFYEVFGKNAKALAERHDLTLTSRTFGEMRMPMIGVPYHAADKYFSRFRKYKKLVIVDGDEVKHIPEYGLEDMIDGTVDDIDDDLSEEEMREFDGDMEEPDDDTEPVQSNGAVDPEVYAKLKKIIGNILA